MRMFVGYRPNPPADYRAAGVAAAPDEVQYEGVVFTDATVVVRWQTEFRSHSVWACWEDFWRVHGHPEYGTRILWDAGISDGMEHLGCAECGLGVDEHATVDGHAWLPPAVPGHGIKDAVRSSVPNLVDVTCRCGDAATLPNTDVDVWVRTHARLGLTWSGPVSLGQGVADGAGRRGLLDPAVSTASGLTRGHHADLVIVDEDPATLHPIPVAGRPDWTTGASDELINDETDTERE